MALQALVSYDGVSLQPSGTLYQVGVPNDSPLWGGAPFDAPLSPVSGGYPFQLSPLPSANGFVFGIDVLILPGATMTNVSALLSLFDPRKAARWLVATDDLGHSWRLSCQVLRAPVPESGARLWHVVLQAADGRWQANTETSQSTPIISTTSATITLVAGGNLAAPLILEATPTVAKGQTHDYTYRAQLIVANRANRALPDYPLVIGFNAQTEIAAGRMQNVSGGEINDLRVWVDGAETDRWLADTGFPSALLVWWVLDLSPRRGAVVTQSGITAGAPATGGNLTTTDPAGFRNLPASGEIVWDSEAISYSAISADGLSLLGITRGVRGTTAASHTAGSPGDATPNVFWIEHQVDLLWGYSTAFLPTPNPTRKPLLDLLNSSNQTWTFADFADALGSRSPQFTTDLQLVNPNVIAVRGAASAVNVLPSANGADTGGTIAGAATRWQAVDDPVATPDDDTSYVALTAINQKFSVTATPPAVPSGALLKVVVTARSRGVGSNTAQGILFVRINGQEYQGDGGGIVRGELTSYATASDVWSTNPATGAPWAAADVAALEFGYRVTALGTATAVRVTQLYVTVTAAADSDPAAALGLYVSPSGAITGHPNRDTWLVATPAGVLGSQAITAVVMTGPGGEAITGQILARDQDGNYVVVSSQSTSAANFSTTLLASADTPLYEIGFRLDTAGVALLTGFAVDSLTVLLDPSQTPLVVVGPRENLYLHRWSLTNANNGEVLTVTWPGALNQKLTVDADAGQVSYALPGYHPRAAVSTDVPRRAWLELEAGSNALGWADAQQGSGQLTLNARWRNRKI